MNVLAAILAFPVGVVLAVVLVAGLIQVLGWTILSLALLNALPAPLAQLAQGALALPLAGSWLGLLLALLLIAAVVFGLYWLASTGTPFPPPAPGLVAAGPAERLGRGALIGFNAGLNYVLLLALLAPLPGGVPTASLLALVNFLACSLTVSNNPVYQIVLAYAALALPMTWPMNLLGALLLAVNGVAAALGVPLTVFAEWTRANLVMHGGVVHGCVRTAFNLGNFTVAHPAMALDDPWFDPGTPVWPFCPPGLAGGAGVFANSARGTVLHEGSHTLNLAAFGWIYHLVGFADQWLPMPWSPAAVRGAAAHSELCAESGLRALGRSWLDMWAPSLAGAGIGNVNAVAALAVTPAPGVVETPPMAIDAATGVPFPTIACERNRAVTLDSSGSTDPDGFPMPLGRLWFLALQPAGSTAAVATPNAAAITFVPDRGGLYQIDLHVTDGADDGIAPGAPGPLPVMLDVLEAVIGQPAGIPAAGTPLLLAGAASAVPAAGAVGAPGFAWAVLAAPAGSALANAVGGAQNFAITPDLSGDYEIELTVTRDVTPLAGGAPVTLADSRRITLTVA